ncbi:MAG: HD domain-containing protein [Gammaproteobacteria bacterium]|nr:MAG: HD domain-containing protein [Gammaproteobacteria bacterium]UCH41086.1 MAG: HD domain-containing protein [Gammaproteobacteria bacterium]
MQTVDFIRMEDGTREEYELLDRLENEHNAGLPDRIMEALRGLEQSFSGYRVSRLEHCLQGATRAHRAGESEEMVVAVLLHDIGDGLAPYSHSEMAAAILRPFVSEKIYWIVKHHGVFQMYYYAHHCGGDRNSREMFRDSPWYQDAIDFCHNYDQNCFDPDYDSEPLEFFEPMLRRVLANPNQLDAEQVARYGQSG